MGRAARHALAGRRDREWWSVALVNRDGADRGDRAGVRPGCRPQHAWGNLAVTAMWGQATAFARSGPGRESEDGGWGSGADGCKKTARRPDGQTARTSVGHQPIVGDSAVTLCSDERCPKFADHVDAQIDVGFRRAIVDDRR